MAFITARVATDFSSFNLKTLLGGDFTLALLDNVGFASAQRFTYEDIARAATASVRFDFAGSGLTVSGGALTGGTVTGLLGWTAGSSGFTPTIAVEKLSISALSAWSAALSASGADDLKLLEDALSGRDTFHLSAGADRAYGRGDSDLMNGGAGNDALFGGDGTDTLNGGVGDDTLDGGSSSDWMVGKSGNDIYMVDAGTDAVIETVDGGRDTVRSSITIELVANVERLVLTGTSMIHGYGNALANTIYGNNGNNELRGGAGDDIVYGLGGRDNLAGDAGADTLAGGPGDDTYMQFEETVRDKVVEALDGGTDQVISDISYVLPANVENLGLYGDANINGTGNALDNTIGGNNGANRLAGGGGADWIMGTFNDTMTGGAGSDTFVLAGHPSGRATQITDFVATDDTIRLDSSVVYWLRDGPLAATAFCVGATAADASDRIVYDQSTGALYYDDDGSGSIAMFQFAQLTAGTVLTAADFVIF